MNDKPDYFTQVLNLIRESAPFLTAFMLSLWGGTVSYIQKINEKRKKFVFQEFAFDLIISSFAGTLMYLLCLSANISGWYQALLIAVTGHMGTRAIAQFTVLVKRVLPVDEEIS